MLTSRHLKSQKDPRNCRRALGFQEVNHPAAFPIPLPRRYLKWVTGNFSALLLLDKQNQYVPQVTANISISRFCNNLLLSMPFKTYFSSLTKPCSLQGLSLLLWAYYLALLLLCSECKLNGNKTEMSQHFQLGRHSVSIQQTYKALSKISSTRYSKQMVINSYQKYAIYSLENAF